MIRKATPEDIPFCHELTVIEDWNFSLEEFSVMASHKSTTIFIAEDEERMGMVASHQYGCKAWIGNLIVVNKFRGEGIGTTLMEKVLKDLESKGVTTVRLEAVHEVVPLYEKLGFVPEFESLRFRGVFHGDKKGESMVTNNILRELSDFDEKYFGANREEFLKGFYQLSPVRLIKRENDTIRGYLMARITPAKVGPCACINGSVFEPLLSAALSHLDGTVSVGIPECNKEGVTLLEEYGFSLIGSSLRMVRGTKNGGIPEKIFAIGGPEKG
jgi:GNAT superfamily N-acetyltransferase